MQPEFDPLAQDQREILHLVDVRDIKHPVRQRGDHEFRIATKTNGVSVVSVASNLGWLTGQIATDEIANREVKKLENTQFSTYFTGVPYSMLEPGDIIHMTVPGSNSPVDVLKCITIAVTNQGKNTDQSQYFLDVQALDMGTQPVRGGASSVPILYYHNQILTKGDGRLCHSGDKEHRPLPRGDKFLTHYIWGERSNEFLLGFVGFEQNIQSGKPSGRPLVQFMSQNPVLLFHGENATTGKRELGVVPINFASASDIQQYVAYVRMENDKLTVFVLPEPFAINNGCTGVANPDHAAAIASARRQLEIAMRPVSERELALARLDCATERIVHIVAQDVNCLPDGCLADYVFSEGLYAAEAVLCGTPPPAVILPIASGYPCQNTPVVLYGCFPVGVGREYPRVLANAALVVVHVRTIAPQLTGSCTVLMNCVFVVHTGTKPQEISDADFVAAVDISGVSAMAGPFAAVLVFDGNTLFYHSGVSPLVFGSTVHVIGDRFTAAILCGVQRTTEDMPPLYQLKADATVYIHRRGGWSASTPAEAEETLRALRDDIDNPNVAISAARIIAQMERVMSAVEVAEFATRMAAHYSVDLGAKARTALVEFIRSKGITDALGSEDMRRLRTLKKHAMATQHAINKVMALLEGMSSKRRISSINVNRKNAARKHVIAQGVAEDKAMTNDQFHELIEQYTEETECLFVALPTCVALAAAAAGVIESDMLTNEDVARNSGDYDDNTDDDDGYSRPRGEQLGFSARLRQLDALSAFCAVAAARSINPLSYRFNSVDLVVLPVVTWITQLDTPYCFWREVALSQVNGEGRELASIRRKLRDLVAAKINKPEGSMDVSQTLVVFLLETLKLYASSINTRTQSVTDTVTVTVRGVLALLFTILASGSNAMYSTSVELFMPDIKTPSFDTAHASWHADLINIARYAMWETAPATKTLLLMFVRRVSAIATTVAVNAKAMVRLEEAKVVTDDNYTRAVEALIVSIVAIRVYRQARTRDAQIDGAEVTRRFDAFMGQSSYRARKFTVGRQSNHVVKTAFTSITGNNVNKVAIGDTELDTAVTHCKERLAKFRDFAAHQPALFAEIVNASELAARYIVDGTGQDKTPHTVQDVYMHTGITRTVRANIQPLLKFLLRTKYVHDRSERNRVSRILRGVHADKSAAISATIETSRLMKMSDDDFTTMTSIVAQIMPQETVAGVTGHTQLVDTSVVTSDQILVATMNAVGLSTSAFKQLALHALTTVDTTIEKLLAVANALVSRV